MFPRIDLDLGGETPHVLQLGTNAFVLLEQHTGKPYAATLTDAEAGSMVAIRSLIWAGLQKHHPTLTVESVGDLIDVVGIATVIDQIAAMGKSATKPAKKAPARRKA